MDETTIRTMLQELAAGRLTVDAAVAALRGMPFEQIADARIDHHRTLRCGFGEVIFCAGKTVQQVRDIFTRLADRTGVVLATRATDEMYAAVTADCPDAAYHGAAAAISIDRSGKEPAGHVAVVAAGTSDLPVAEEARVTAETMGAAVTTHYDVGVAGLHRLLADREKIDRANAVVAVAGMEGALASVVGGLVSAPVIGVPTSIGYGANFGGVSALLTMLNSCASGVTVVNIDNGFAGGYCAAMINARVLAGGSGGGDTAGNGT